MTFMTAKLSLVLKSRISFDNFTTGRITSASSDTGLEVTLTSISADVELVIANLYSPGCK